MKKLNTSVVYVLYVHLFITMTKTRNIDKSQVGGTLKYHKFEVMTSEILGFEGQKYEEVDYFSWVCALCHFYITSE